MALVYMRAEDVGREINNRLLGIQQGVSIGDKGEKYETNICSTVWRGRRKIPADDQVPVCIILEGDDEPGSQPNKYSQQIVQSYVLDAFDQCDPDNPNDKAHMMLRDLKRAIFHDGGDFGGGVRSIKYLGRDIGPRPDGAGFVQVRIVIEVEYVENFQTP